MQTKVWDENPCDTSSGLVAPPVGGFGPGSPEQGERAGESLPFLVLADQPSGGRITASITWITPLVASMSAVEIAAPLTLGPPSSVMVTSAP